MTATQTLRIYDVLGKYFGNQPDANIVVTEIEQIVDNKFEEKGGLLANKEDISSVRNDIHELRLASKEDVGSIRETISVLKLEIKEVQIGIERRFNQQIIWLISTAIALAGFTLAVIKL